MKKEDFIKLGIEEELAEKCAEAVAKTLEGYVSKKDYEVLESEKEQAVKTIEERDSQLEELKKSTGDLDSLNSKIEELQKANEEASNQHKAEIKQLKIEHAVDSALNGAGAKNLKAVRALLEIDAEKISVKEDGTLDGFDIDEQIKTLKSAEDSKFMFKEEISKPSFKGVNPAPSDPKNGEGIDLSKMSYQEICEYMEQNPDAEI